MRRIEQKFSCPPDFALQDLPMDGELEEVEVREEVDTHFCTRAGSLFLRRTQGGAELVSLRRLHTPLPRVSAARSVPPGNPTLGEMLAETLGIKAEVCKSRRRYLFHHQGLEMRVDLDQVAGLGGFVELSLAVEGPLDPPDPSGPQVSSAQVVAFQILAEQLGLDGADALPYSYADLAVMMATSLRYRNALSDAATAGSVGRMIILDGASCSGKTTLGSWLLNESGLGLRLVPRYTTRPPRPGEEEGSEYLFTSPEELHRLTETGELFEYRDFEFGMSYGLPWEAALKVLTSGHNGIGIMNLGNVRHVKRVFPEAVTILIHSPIEEIERRLHERGMPESHIAERLGNARRVESYRQHYDHVVENEDGRLETAQAALRKIVRPAS
jgi:guanylate kinase